jgi:hypothetical protein
MFSLTLMSKGEKSLISISEFWIPGVGGVKETHDKNDEIVKCKTTMFQSFGYLELEESRKQLTIGTRDMRNHKKIWTVESSRSWTVKMKREALK